MGGANKDTLGPRKRTLYGVREFEIDCLGLGYPIVPLVNPPSSLSTDPVHGKHCYQKTSIHSLSH